MKKPPKFDPTSHTFTDDRLAQLRELCPEAFTEQGIDFDRLKTLLGEKVEVGSERYSFTWPGKTEAIRAAQTPSMGTLVPDKESSVDWDTTQNLYLEGDNLEILKLLQKSYTGKVKMIYIDPPYNTGKDFVYPDKYGEGLKTYLEYTGQIDGEGKKLSTNTETDGRYHSKWLSMMYPRFMLARNLLKDDGVLFISIDDHEVFNLRRICNEIFGEENFVGQIVRATGTTTGQDAKKLGSSLDYCCVYRKSEAFSPTGLRMTEKDKKRFKYDDSDGKGKYALLQLRKTGSGDRKEDRPNMFYPIIAPNGEGVVPFGPSDYLSRWRAEEKTYNQWMKDGMIVWLEKELEDVLEEDDDDDGTEAEVEVSTRKIRQNDSEQVAYTRSKWVPYVKYYLENRTKRPSNLWVDVEGNKKGSIQVRDLLGGKYFDNPKPIGFLDKILSISTSSKSAIVLDFFSGSATTAHAVMALNAGDGGNRQFIMSQLQEPTPEVSEAKKAGYMNIAEIGKERIRRAGQKIREEYVEKITVRETPLDTGFKVYRLALSTFSVWDAKPEDDLQKKLLEVTSLIRSGAKEEDILTELILKSGYGLTEKVGKMEIEGKKLYSVADGSLIVSLGSGLTLPLIRKVAERTPSRFIAREQGFASDDVLVNTAQIMKDKAIDFRVL